jgi:hypothetical protein
VDKAKDGGRQRFRQLLHILPEVEEKLILEGLVKILQLDAEIERNYMAQEYAGQILKVIGPKSEFELGELLRLTLRTWDVSVQEFPFWIEKNYGISAIELEMRKLEVEMKDETGLKKLATMKWWLKIE